MDDREDSATPLRFPAGALKRPRFEAGHYLAAGDLAIWQRYRLQRLRRHRRYLHGWGVVCGLNVVPAPEPRQPWAVLVCPGYAIGPYGDEIEVTTQVPIDLREYLWLAPPRLLTNLIKPPPVFLGLRYVERGHRLMPANVPSCGCEDVRDQPTRISDSFRLDVLWQPQLSGQIIEFDPCTKTSAACPDCPQSADLLLACIKLPPTDSEPIKSNDIDNWTFRKQL